MVFAIVAAVAIVALCAGYFVGRPRTSSGVPAEYEMQRVLKQAIAEHELHQRGHHTQYPSVIAESAIRHRVRATLKECGFKYVPLDLHDRIKELRNGKT